MALLNKMHNMCLVPVHRAASIIQFLFLSPTILVGCSYYVIPLDMVNLCADPKTDLETVCVRMRCLIAQCVTLLNSIRSYILFHGGILSLSGRYTLKNDRKVRKMQCRRCWSLHYKSIKPFLYRISTRSHAFFAYVARSLFHSSRLFASFV